MAPPVSLSPQKKRFAAEMLRPGANQTKAAALAGSKQPKVQGSRWAKDPEVRKYMTSLKRAARAMAEQPEPEAGQPDEQRESNPVSVTVLPVVADLAEVLQVQTHAMRTVGYRKVKRGWMEYQEQPDGSKVPVKVEATVDGMKAADALGRHYDDEADRDAGVKAGANVQALIVQLVNGPGATLDARKLLRSVLGTGGE
jgi:phage terminase small subunit